ncbi:hypothetical protein ACFQ34_02610 [Pseudonocardia benzenivorans]|uniref:PspA domain-containing protein n=2 Tax=Pseudonocardia TaxID=1847 RepID=F4D0E4_PSEUX|nr:hypothetical protein [Pseudonocardia dioxanivorans]AEA26740.1 hypothetical protein Psed_4588 [Pseudonocardia dioxanivorans CB1190]GJF05855.1 hypothetical protein PSD17_48040 [Pseudonocardia sp. D17]
MTDDPTRAEPPAENAEDASPAPEQAGTAAAITPAVPEPGLPVPPVPGVENPTGYTDAGVPTLDYVRDKIEGRWATSLGTAELAGETEAGRSIAEQEAEREKKAKEKLDEIRRSLGGG